ncbi:hypothetical protein HBB16_05855 [Pseudonocardia sp. MCCB 268]|nr:hypothetical protein [Pseudonocardia cytotoxica]
MAFATFCRRPGRGRGDRGRISAGGVDATNVADADVAVVPLIGLDHAGVPRRRHILDIARGEGWIIKEGLVAVPPPRTGSKVAEVLIPSAAPRSAPRSPGGRWSSASGSGRSPSAGSD